MVHRSVLHYEFVVLNTKDASSKKRKELLKLFG